MNQQIITDPPMVSVLMTAYNREKFIAEAIESVLTSTFENFELIIVDDQSTDNTLAIAREYSTKDNRIKVYLNEKNLGDYANRNEAASKASGKYLKYVDSDDMIFPQTLQVMVEAMEQFPDAGFGISSRSEQATGFYSSSEAYHHNFFVRSFMDMGPSFVIIHTQRFSDCGGFKTIRNVSDFDMWLRMASRYPVIELPKGIIYWREHENQEFRIASDLYIEYNYAILLENLNSPTCPLSKEESASLLEKSRRTTVKEAVKQVVKKQKFSLFFKVAKKYKFGWKDYLKLFKS